MALNIIVCAKQVVDPETPASAFRINPDTKQVVPAQGIPPVVNGFDENAVEAALQVIEASSDATITVLSVGSGFVMDVMKKPLSMGADQLILVDDPAVGNLDAFGTATALAEAIRKIGEYDLILCGRQASDWDNAMVPLGIAEILGLPCITIAQKIEVSDDGVTVHKALSDGYEVVKAGLPAVVTITNELGEPRYPTLRGIMMASRKTPTVWDASEVGLSHDLLSHKLDLTELYIPVSDTECEFIEGEDDADSGRLLALKLREARLI